MLKENERTVENVAAEVKKCLNENGVEKVTFKIGESGKLPECLDVFQLDLILSELTDNCKDCGAKEITVTFEDNKIRIEDDVRHKNASEVARGLNGIRSSEVKVDPKKWQEVVFGKVGGIGVSELVLGILEKTGGSLTYTVIDKNRIAAEISW